ncbi:MAG: hypothetical protein MUC82_00525 [Cypionkella sp.]|jgi:hypothetical protein|nr:hypothetical protein [Cypionkella sp.]
MSGLAVVIGLSFLAGFGFALGVAAWEVVILAGCKGRHIALTLARVSECQRTEAP